MKIAKFLLGGLLTSFVLLSTVNCVNAEEGNIGEVVYINGGIGQEESDEIRAKAGDFNLRLYMSEGKHGHSITGVKVSIINKKGNVVLDLLSGGPMLFAHVANGNYVLKAIYEGTTITRKVLVINHRGVNVYLNWRAKDVNDDNDSEDGSSL
jgi:hypothetical protein